MMVLFKDRTVCFSKLSNCFDSPAKADSCLRRIQRFLRNILSVNTLLQNSFFTCCREKGNAVSAYRQRWQIETMFRTVKSAGFNIEATHLSDIERIEKLLLIVMMAFVWCCNIGVFVHRNLKAIRILQHGQKAKSIFRYGLDIFTESLVRGRNDHQLRFFDFLIINEMQLNVTG